MSATENSERNSENAKNLAPHQFRPGQSGNPGGRPKKLPITDYIIEQLEKPIPAATRAKLPPIFTEVYGDKATFGEMLAFKVIAQAAKGNMTAMNTVMDRVEGKVRQNVALTGDGLVVRIIDDL
jgi:hypothetical protein